MAQTKPPKAVLEYVEFLRETFSGLKKAYVFGSYAKGAAGGDSDIDIAVVFDKVGDSFDLQVQLMRIR
ncbi:MAG: nucleotidyltransferase domain-containing protein, partial [Desulfatiglandaceae bacterium]